MTYIGLGCLCFLFFILYDLNQIHKNHRGIRPLFAVGCITLCVLTITMSVTEFESDYQVTFPAVAVFFLLAGIQLMLLVLFLAGFYLFLSLGLGKPFMLLAGTVYTGMNLLYILLQDRYTFPRLFEGYDDYRKETPYLIPDADSIRKCISDLKTGRMEKTAGKGGDES